MVVGGAVAMSAAVWFSPLNQADREIEESR